MMSVFVDRTANMAAIDLRPGQLIDRTEEVGASLLASYDAAGDLVSVEILSLKAVQHPAVVAELHTLLGQLGELSEGTGFMGAGFGSFSAVTISPHRLNLVDLLIQQINRATVEDGNAQQENPLLV